jgi:hypothetical protein
MNEPYPEYPSKHAHDRKGIVFYDNAQLERIQTAAEEQDWFTAIVLSATQLEKHGCAKIKKYLESLKVDPRISDAILEPLYLRDVAQCLLVMKTIDKQEYDTIMKVNEVRKHFIHRREQEKFKRGKEAQKEYQLLVNKAKRILIKKLDVTRGYIAKV